MTVNPSPKSACGLIALLLLPIFACGGGPKPSSPEAPRYPLVALHGVNYAPDLPVDALSYTPLKLEGQGKWVAEDGVGEPLELSASYASWIAGVAYTGPGSDPATIDQRCRQAEDGSTVAESETEPGILVICDLELVRFGQYGSVPASASGEARSMDWMLELDPQTVRGELHIRRDDQGRLVYPGEVEFQLGFVLTLQQQDAGGGNGSNGETRRLVSETPARFSGALEGWPQGLLVLSLREPALRLEPEEGGGPGIELQRLTLAFADKPSEFFRRHPEPQVVITPGTESEDGVRLRWTPTAEAVRSSVIEFYDIYRNRNPGQLDGWHRVAQVPASRTEWVDRDAEAGELVEYLVVHAVEFPFGHLFEGIYGAPASTAGP